MRFPTRKPDIDALTNAILAGIAANPIDYPSGPGQPFNTANLTNFNNTKNTAKNTRQQEEGQFRVAVTAENGSYDVVTDEVRRFVNLAIAVHGIKSPKLLLIGWAPLAEGESFVPGQPRALEAVIQGQTDTFLDWKSPAPAAGKGEVSHYRIERRIRTLQGQQTEDWGAWQATAIETEIVLSGLERGVEYDFRVIAVNVAGDSAPSNTVTLVL
ncbi:MAG: fibronectin type III domain-containing protein [Fimbriimonadaceae bacterium]